MKKIFALILVSAAVFIATGVTAFADCGPKPSATVYVRGVESGREYYATLLTEAKWLPPGRSMYEGGDPEFIAKQSPEWRAFYEFSQTDEYNYLQTSAKLSGEGSFSWGYYPPDKFKVLLYFPDDGSLIVSEPQETYAFYSDFVAKVSGGSIAVKRAEWVSLSFGADELAGFLVRVVITVLIEIGVAALFGYRNKKAIKLIMFMNIVTQLLLNIVLNIADLYTGLRGALIVYAVLEIVVFIIEAIVYQANLPSMTEWKTKEGRAVLYALAANAVSFVVGGALLTVLDAVSDSLSAM